MMRALAGVVAAAAAAGCSDAPPPGDAVPCAGGFLGDPSKPVAFELIVANETFDAVPLDDGGTAPMLVPLQGGEVVFVGVRATNVDACGLLLTGALRDETTQQVRFDQRTINLIPIGGGWGATGPIGMSVAGAVSNFANIPVCPNQWATTDVDGHEYGLEVTLQDRGGRSLEKKVRVTPACSEPASFSDCVCICKKGYVLGSDCTEADAGSDSP